MGPGKHFSWEKKDLRVKGAYCSQYGLEGDFCEFWRELGGGSRERNCLWSVFVAPVPVLTAQQL